MFGRNKQYDKDLASDNKMLLKSRMWLAAVGVFCFSALDTEGAPD